MGLPVAGSRAAPDARSDVSMGDGALGFWTAVRSVSLRKTLWQSDWVHKAANVLDALPKSVHRKAKKAIREVTEAETDLT
jgi:putative transposase